VNVFFYNANIITCKRKGFAFISYLIYYCIGYYLFLILQK